MNTFPMHTLETAPSKSRPLLRQLTEQLGFIPNLAATMAGSSTLLETFLGARSRVQQGSLPGAARETISLAVSYENSCSYCMAAHSVFAQGAGVPEPVIEALRAGEEPPADFAELKAIASFTRKVLAPGGGAGEEDVQAMFDAGYTQDQLLETVAVIGFTALANWTHNLARTPVDEAFGDRAWRPRVEAAA